MTEIQPTTNVSRTESADRAGGGFVDVNGLTLHYAEQGTGSPLVLLHGGLMSHRMWDPLLPFLVDRFRVIAPDTRGHGRSTNPSGELSYPLAADDAAALIAELGLVDPVVAGYSDGGQVALELGARHPGVAAALVIGAAYPDFSVIDTAGLSSVFYDDAGRLDLDKLEGYMGERAHVKSWQPGGDAQWRAVVEQSLPMWLQYEGLTPEAVGAIDVPTLVFSGDSDTMIGVDLMLALARMLPHAEFAVAPQTGHYEAFEPERAEVFARLLGDFAARHSSR